MTSLGLRACAVLTAGLLFSWSLEGCSLAFDLERTQCESAADCEGFGNATCQENVCVLIATGGGGSGGEGTGGSGGAPDPNWACLGNVVPPDPGGSTIIHDYRFELATGQPGTPPANLSIKVCAAIDTLCMSPLSGIPQPDASGSVLLELAVGFDGFLQVTSDETMPTTVFLQRPIVIPQEQKVIRMVSQTTFEGLVGAAGQTWDQTRGAAVILTNNCLDLRAAGVRVESPSADGETVTFHFKGALPDPESLQTDEQGAAGFLNMPVGVIGVDIYRASTDQFIGSGSFRSQAGVLSYLPIAPTAAE